MARTAKKEKALTPEEKLAQALVPDVEQPYRVPDNWCWTTMDRVAQWGSGGTPSRGNPSFFGGNIPWVKTGELNDDYIFYTEETLSEDGLTHSSAKLFPINTIIIAMYGATVGKVGILGIEAATNQACACGKCSSAVDYKYLYFYARSQKDIFIDKARGGAQPNISQEIIKSHPIPIPPIIEQQRIVDRIESLFAKLDETKEKAQAVVDGFEDRKAAILHKAFTGELTRLWASQHGISVDAWKMKYFDDVAEVKSNLVDPAEYPDYPHIAPDNIEKKTGKLLDYNTVAEDAVKSGKHRFYAGQILYSKIRPNLSKVVVINFDGLCSADMYPIEPKDGVNTKFLWYYMLSDDFVLQASTAGSRSVLPKINQKELASLKIRITDFKEQEKIVAVLDKLFEKEQQAKEAAEQVIDQIDSMKKSILARAFRGELRTNDTNDESAVELLKRVLAEGQSDDTSSKLVRKRTVIPKEIDSQLSTGMERDIIKLFIKADNESVTMDAIMAVSSKKFEILDTLRSLEKKGIIQKNDVGDYSLIK